MRRVTLTETACVLACVLALAGPGLAGDKNGQLEESLKGQYVLTKTGIDRVRITSPRTILVTRSAWSQGPSAGAALTNADVLKMIAAKLGDAIVISKIKSSRCNFDTSTDALIKLKRDGVSDPVIQAMTECGAPGALATVPAHPAGASGALPGPGPVTEIGVYHKVGDEWHQLEPEVVNVKSGGMGKTFLSGGLVKPDINAHLNGNHSNNQVRTPVEFLIYVADGVGITEYQLIRLHEQKDSREFRTVTGGVLHTSSGATRDLVQFDGKKIADRTYVIELGTLGAGEYGFLPPGAVLSSSGGSVGKMYSFRVLE
ncbi:MAG TPA: hypothetical protein VG206_04075 [Terriglobia bacterium]|nr:hypothetical protein [Terriglobia bacterium]